MSNVLQLTKYSLKTTLRSPRVVIFSLAFPIVLLILFAGMFGSGQDNQTTTVSGSLSGDAYFTAGIAAYAMLMSCFSNIAIGLTARRETGQLKRLRGTPMRPWHFMASQILASTVLVIAMVIVLFAIGILAFGVSVPDENVPAIILYVLLGTASLSTLGIALTTLTTSADSASTIAPFGAVILGFISGVFIPIDQLPNWLEDIGKIFPLYYLACGLQNSLVEGAADMGLLASNLAVLVAWTLLGMVVAVRGFRWEPQAVKS